MEKRTSLVEFLEYKTLNLKFSLMNDTLREALLEESGDKKFVKNVCAKMPISLVEELEKTVGLLNCSKRQFIEYAISDAIRKASEVIDDYDFDDLFGEQK